MARRRVNPEHSTRDKNYYRSVNVPTHLHRVLSHVSIDYDIPIARIVEILIEAFLNANEDNGPEDPLEFYDLRVKPKKGE